MGYQLRIERRAGPPISLKEWEAFVKTQTDMHWSKRDWMEVVEKGKRVRRYAVLWTGSKFRDEHPAHKEIPFWFANGVISSPAMADEDDVHLAEVAKALGAELYGEDGPFTP